MCFWRDHGFASFSMAGFWCLPGSRSNMGICWGILVRLFDIVQLIQIVAVSLLYFKPERVGYFSFFLITVLSLLQLLRNNGQYSSQAITDIKYCITLSSPSSRCLLVFKYLWISNMHSVITKFITRRHLRINFLSLYRNWWFYFLCI